MTIDVRNNIEPCRDNVVFSFPKEKITEIVNVIAKEIGKNYQIKGYRKGKAPIDAVKTIAKDHVLQEARRRLLNEAFQDILYELKIKPFGEPEIVSLKMNDYSSFVVDLKLGYLPAFELKQYKDFILQAPPPPNEQEFMDRAMMNLRKQFPKLRQFDSAGDLVMDGDHIVVDYESTVDGKEFQNSSAKGLLIEIGSGNFIRDFEVNVMGMSIGENREFDISFPEGFHVKELSGKTVHFKVTLTAGAKKDLPEINEEFLKNVNANSIEELNQKLKLHVDVAVGAAKKNGIKSVLIDKLLESNTIEVPDWMVSANAKNIAAKYGVEFNKADDAVKTAIMAESLKALRVALIFDKIRELEVETVLSDEEINQVIRQNINNIPNDVRAAINSPNGSGAMMRLYSEIQDEQVFEWLIQHNVVAVLGEPSPTNSSSEPSVENKTESTG